MADKPTEWLAARVRINVSKSDGGRAASYGWLIREISIPIKPALPDHVDLELVTGHRTTVKVNPLTWDAANAEYRVADVTIVLNSAEITRLQADTPGGIRTA